MNLAYRKHYMKKDEDERMNGYELSKRWFEFAYDCPELKPYHTSLYFYIVDLANRLGWKKHIGLHSQETMSFAKIGNRRTYKSALQKLEDWGFIEWTHKAQNQYTGCDQVCLCNSEQSLNNHYKNESSFVNNHCSITAQSPKVKVQERTITEQSLNASINLYKPVKTNNNIYRSNTDLEQKKIETASQEPEKKERKNSGKKKESNSQAKKFIKPTVEQVFDYMLERGLQEREAEFQSEKYIDRYESGGWMVGKHKMKDWKAAVRNWISNMDDWNSYKFPKDQNSHTQQKPHSTFQEMVKRAQTDSKSITLQDIENL